MDGAVEEKEALLGERLGRSDGIMDGVSEFRVDPAVGEYERS
jgi:hypothetical protein